MNNRIQKFGKGTVNINGTLIHYFRVRVLNNENNINIFNKYDVNFVYTTALIKRKNITDKVLQQYLEVNLISTDYNDFKDKELNIYRALREVAMLKIDNKYSFILYMSNISHIYS
jgi:hypothetical protein